ncbi:hypothetical protein OIE13_06050 [Streptosporangium sp. NBC_01810]|uniref:hypothetical protein n=1 Tax=Streptosporangium sp. NBC_01810 TaxID=2975951 RepID=UPI002DDB6F32|nr:hypothetical protein [Streptosporangium sp. NBC_01810]WSA27436.1 hypothetical protein OIE13_06050 [Streptosporangium sp. NBC_01810]
MPLTCPTPSCARTMPGHLRVCRACSTDLLRDLRDVPSLAHHMELAAAKQTRLGTSGGSPARELGEHADEIGLTIRKAPLPWDERARTAQHALRTVLVGWVRVLQHGVRPYEGPRCQDCAHRSCTYLSLGRSPADTLPAMAVWLIRHRAVLLGRDAAPEAVDGIREAIRQARRTIDRPADRIYAGPCNQCERDLYARPGAPTVDCGPCRLRYDVQDRRDWMLAHAEEMLGGSVWVANVATGLGFKVSPSTIRMWALRGKLTPRTWTPSRTTTADPQPLYRVGDIIALVIRRAPAPSRGALDTSRPADHPASDKPGQA